MDAQKFFDVQVRGYLLCDLEEMSKVDLPVGEIYGGCAYPMLSAIMSGSELLGLLLSKRKLYFEGNPEKTEKAILDEGQNGFHRFWKNYMSAINPRYKPLNLLFRKLIRNKLSHNFLTGTYIEVGGNPDYEHLFLSKNPPRLVIKPQDLFLDFKKAVEDYLENFQKNSEDVQARINELEKYYQEVSSSEFSSIGDLNVSTLSHITARSSGASTSFPPTRTSESKSVGTTSFDSVNDSNSVTKQIFDT